MTVIGARDPSRPCRRQWGRIGSAHGRSDVGRGAGAGRGAGRAAGEQRGVRGSGAPLGLGGSPCRGRPRGAGSPPGREAARGVPGVPHTGRRGRRGTRLRCLPGAARAGPLALGGRRRRHGGPLRAGRAVPREGPGPRTPRRAPGRASRGRGLRGDRGLRRRHRGVGRAVGSRHVRPRPHRRRRRDLPPGLCPAGMAGRQRPPPRHDLVRPPGGRRRPRTPPRPRGQAGPFARWYTDWLEKAERTARQAGAGV